MFNIWSKSGKFHENNIGIHPQALIRHFKPIINHNNLIINPKQCQTKPKKRLYMFTLFFAPGICGSVDAWIRLVESCLAEGHLVESHRAL